MNNGKMIFLYGPPLSGKSTIGEMFARRVDLPFYDLDKLIESRTVMTIPEIFSTKGEDYFRDLECSVLEEICNEDIGIVALGGGALIRSKARKLVEDRGEVILLQASSQVLISRMKGDQNKRPLLGASTEKEIIDLLNKREEHYNSFPAQIQTDQDTVDDILFELEALLGVFLVSGMGTSYQVQFSSGIVNDLGKKLRLLKRGGPITVVSDQNVADLYAGSVLASLDEAGYQSSLIVFPPGENSKTMDTVQNIWDGFLKANVDRGSTVIALGGGVVGDLTGFAAATFHRGVDWVNIPTSLLAMVDAGIGGKTGVDLPQGKNLVGAFHPPRQVWIDPGFLQSLPEIELQNGMAEVIKHGVISDPDLFALALEGRSPFDLNRSEILRRAVAVKVAIIQKDPYDQNLRQVLNFGHTLGHAVELASDFKLSHGESIAIGMVAETRTAEIMGLTAPGLLEKIISILNEWDLPVDLPSFLSLERIWESVRRDKKKSAGRLQFALPLNIGQVKAKIEVDEKTWKSVLRIRK